MELPVLKEPIRGFIPQVQRRGHDLSERTVRLIPWHQSARISENGGPERWNPRVFAEASPVPRHMVEQMQAGLPPMIRRTSRERYQVLIDRLVADGLRSYRIHGYPVWPKSIADELRIAGWKEGDPDLWGQVEALAKRFIVKAEHKQKESDRHKVVSDWHSHFD
jgi:hypothetical protein